jgi:hypothetical protein
MFFLMPYLKENIDVAKVDWNSLNFNFSYITKWGPDSYLNIKSLSESEFYCDAYNHLLAHVDLDDVAAACGNPRRAQLAADTYDYIISVGGL